MPHPLKSLIFLLMASSAINASEIPDVEVISDSSRINRSVIRSDSAHREVSNYYRHTSFSSIEPPLRSHRTEAQTVASPIAMVIINNIIPERTASRRVSNPQQSRSTASPAYRLPDDIQGLYKASQGSDNGRATAAFEELKKKAQGGSLTAIDCVSKCYINGYGCSMSEHWSNFWQDKYDRARRRR